MIRYVSTRRNDISITSHETLIRGLSDDGGLFLPSSFPHLIPSASASFSYQETACRIIQSFFDDFDPEVIRECVSGAYGSKFGSSEIVPLRKISDGWLAELWHGPTAAFKDIALTILPRLLKAACRMDGCDDTLLILTATSGDTGKAALSGFADVENTFVTVFYPEDGVSEMQKLQMQTAAGNNVRVIAVKGNFDDCQRMVKEVTSLAEIREGVPGVRLSSANSINTGRLIPQIVYYYTSYEHLLQQGVIQNGDAVDFAVPTGNFGDILAGYLAKRSGLPIRRLICASNRNHVLTDFLETGTYSIDRPFHHTISPSMDILVSGNLERLLSYESGFDAFFVSACMSDLKTKGSFAVPEEIMERIRKHITGCWTDEDECRRTIRQLYEAEGVLIDPHTAVALSASRRCRKDDVPMIILSTASPYKFPSDVLECLTEKKSGSGFTAMRELSELTSLAAPAPLRDLETLPKRFREVIRQEEGKDVIQKIMQEISR